MLESPPSLWKRQTRLNAQMSGTTATVAIHDHASNKLLGFFKDDANNSLP